MSFKASTATPPSKVTPPGVKEYTVKLARDVKKKYSVMQFNRGDKIDFSKCSKVVMDRENNLREFHPGDDDMPTQGAGSEFGRGRREEARRKKYGIISKKYKPEDQPWILRVAGKPEKKYRGKKEGSISENASYYLFTQQADGTFHAVPVDSWYMFQQSIKHSTLNAEEAEEEFNRRDRSYNYFSLMVQKRLKEKTGDDVAAPDEGEKKKAVKSKSKSLTILEDDDYRDLMSSGESSDEIDEDDKDKKKPKKKKKGPARPRKKDSGSEAEEESDTGDFEGREFDYLSEVSSDDEEEEIKTDIKGLDEEMKKMEDEEEEEAEEEEAKEGGDEEKKKETEGETKDAEKSASKESSDSCGSDSEDSDIDDTKIQSSIFMQKKSTSKKPQSSQKSSSKSSSRAGSRPGTPITGTPIAGGDSTAKTSTDTTLSGAAVKLETPNAAAAGVKRPGSAEPRPSKKARTESPVPSGSKTPTPEVGLTEDVVRRYLMRKPMTTKDLLYKLNPKKTGLTSEEVVKRVTMILRKLNPEKRKIKDKMYWHIKDDGKTTSR